MPRFAAAVAAAASLVALTAPAGARQATTRVVEFAVSVSGTQTTSWTSHGSVTWCSSSSQALTYDGNGRETTRFRFPKAVPAPLRPGVAPAVQSSATATIVRTGSVVAHDAAVTSRPAGCPSLPTTDTAAQSAPCGSRSLSLQVLVAPTMRSSTRHEPGNELLVARRAHARPDARHPG